MAATLEKVEKFDAGCEEWSQYVERLGHFFAANGIDTAEKKKSAFLAVIGPPVYKQLRNLVSPEKPGDKTYVRAAGKGDDQALQQYHQKLYSDTNFTAVSVSQVSL